MPDTMEQLKITLKALKNRSKIRLYLLVFNILLIVLTFFSAPVLGDEIIGISIALSVVLILTTNMFLRTLSQRSDITHAILRLELDEQLLKIKEHYEALHRASQQSTTKPCFEFFPNLDSVETIKQTYKTLAKIHHPDVGGDLRIFQTLTDEYNKALKFLSK